MLLVLATGGSALAAGRGGNATLTASATAAPTAGCGKAPTLTSGTYTIQSGGKNRSFILKVPDGYDRDHAYRLVLGFHWLGGTSTDVATGRTVETGTWAYYGLQRLANNSAVFVAPQGLNNGWANSGGEDVAFVDDILRRIEADLCVDTTQRFALGFSYGAAMSYALACARATVFRAVAVQSGGQLSGCSGGTQPIAYLGVHGLRDNVLAISGGRAMRDTFVRNNGCTPQNPPEPAQGSLTHWVPGEVWKFFTQFQTSDPSPGTATCRVTDTVSAWNSGLTSNITITNTGTTAIDGWSLVFTLPGGQAITSGWNADYSPASGQVTARHLSHNATIAPGASVGIGFQAVHAGDTAAPGSYTLNGNTCAVSGS
ncbi:MAG: cellulose binding domain-containing protein [Streptomyces sp.]|nr:cellulose binding domain-containing protein [Streptomyces sp.]